MPLKITVVATPEIILSSRDVPVVPNRRICRGPRCDVVVAKESSVERLSIGVGKA